MSNSKISVIVPIYNCEKFLKGTIESIINQNYKEMEIILINDGSKDRSLAICNKYKQNDNRIKVIDKMNSGVSDTRNKGIEAANGKYIAFIDADDYLEKNTFSNLINIAEKYAPDLITTGFFSEVNKEHYDEIYSKEKFYHSKEEINKDIVKLWDNHILYNIWNKLYLKDILDKHNILFPNKNWGEDIIFNQIYLKYTNTLYNTSKCYYHYIREREGAITKKYDINLFSIRVRENEEFIKYFKEIGIAEKDYIEFVARRYIDRTLGCIQNVCALRGDISFKNKYKKVKEIIEHTDTRKYIKIAKIKSLKMKILLIPYKIHMPILAITLGKIISFIREKMPAVFNKLKNSR